eukprot:gene534-11880_t
MFRMSHTAQILPTLDYHLVCNGHLLNDHDTVLDCNFGTNPTLDLVVKNHSTQIQIFVMTPAGLRTLETSSVIDPAILRAQLACTESGASAMRMIHHNSGQEIEELKEFQLQTGDTIELYPRLRGGLCGNDCGTLKKIMHMKSMKGQHAVCDFCKCVNCSRAQQTRLEGGAAHRNGAAVHISCKRCSSCQASRISFTADDDDQS